MRFQKDLPECWVNETIVSALAPTQTGFSPSRKARVKMSSEKGPKCIYAQEHKLHNYYYFGGHREKKNKKSEKSSEYFFH